MVVSLYIFSSNMIKNKNIQFILYLIAFTLTLDIAVGNIYDKLYFSDKSKKQDRLIHSAIGTNEDVLIFGSSRAYLHYNPQIIEDSLGMSCYNVGYGGQNIYFHLALLESALERYKPKIAILELMTIDFEKTASIYETEKLGILLPFAKKSAAIYDAVMRRGWSEKFKLLSAIYPLNSKQLYMLWNNFTTVKSHNKGFAVLNKVWNKPIEESQYNIKEIDSKKMDALFRFIDLCKENKVELFLFISPHYTIKKGENQFAKLEEILFANYQLKINNMESDKLFLSNPGYFADPFHLNRAGTSIYTRIIAEKIKYKKLLDNY